MRVLQTDQPRADLMIVGRADFAVKLRDVEDAVVALESPARYAAEGGWPAGLIVVNVAGRLAQQLVPRLRVGPDANLVGHGTRRHEERRLLTEQRRHFFLEAIYRRVLSENIVANLCRQHDGAHGRRRLRHGIAAQIDWRFGWHGVPLDHFCLSSRYQSCWIFFMKTRCIGTDGN